MNARQLDDLDQRHEVYRCLKTRIEYFHRTGRLGRRNELEEIRRGGEEEQKSH